jgi:hypothetical protein
MEERRKDYPDIINKVNDIDKNLSSLVAIVAEREKTTQIWRVKVDSELGKINEKLALLPCSERKGWYSSMNRQVGLLWSITIGVVVKVIWDWINGIH